MKYSCSYIFQLCVYWFRCRTAYAWQLLLCCCCCVVSSHLVRGSFFVQTKPSRMFVVQRCNNNEFSVWPQASVTTWTSWTQSVVRRWASTWCWTAWVHRPQHGRRLSRDTWTSRPHWLLLPAHKPPRRAPIRAGGSEGSCPRGLHHFSSQYLSTRLPLPLQTEIWIMKELLLQFCSGSCSFSSTVF